MTKYNKQCIVNNNILNYTILEKNGKLMKKRRMFGRLIRNIRDLQNISREELSRGICSVKALEKYESGERELENWLH